MFTYIHNFCASLFWVRKEDKGSFSPQNLLVEDLRVALPAGAPDERG